MNRDGLDPAKSFLGVGWAFPVQADPSVGDMSTAVYEEDIRQAILLILETNLGERVMRPDFGSGLRELVFEPLNTRTMALVQHRVEQALITWEPRIRVQEVRVQAQGTARNTLLVTISYEVRATNTFYNLVYPFYLQEGRP
ncbi:MAG: GPW/gp25 family protein [Nitrospira sp.]|nr:GPW/gp25 family protein [Nitrospira sp.]